MSATGRLRGVQPASGMLALLVFALLTSAAVANDKAYDVSVLGIRATKSNSQISPELKPIAAELKKRFNYTGFKLERKTKRSVNKGKTLSTDLVAGFKAKITPIERKGRRLKLKIEITKREGSKERRLANTTITITSGRYQLLGGWKIDSKGQDVLITAISAR